VQFNVDVYFPEEGAWWPLGEISPVVHTLARRQFDDYVKRVRIFIHPRLARAARELSELETLLIRSIEATPG
jgi:hypothetical protein